MEFIQKMKKREFIEMGLKTLAAVLAAFLAIILMEGMIYSIKLNALKNATSSMSNSGSTIAYCIKEDDNKYFVIYKNWDEDKNEYTWCASKNDLKTKEECEQLTAKEIVFHAPNAFEFSITPIHFVVMFIFMAGVGGFFAYKFVALTKEYKRIEENFKKTGTIEF